MPELRALLTDAGFEDVRTYVQSGNVVLTARPRPTRSRREAEKLIAERFGFDVDVIARTADELAEVVRLNPLADVAENPKRYQVSFCDGEPDPEAIEKVAAAAAPSEKLVAVGRELYAWHPDGVGRSKMWTKLAGYGVRRPRHRAQLDDGHHAARDGARVMTMRRYTIADVFTDVPLQGNQVAVFTDAIGPERRDHAARRARAEPVRDRVRVPLGRTRTRICECGSSPRPPSCRSPAIRSSGRRSSSAGRWDRTWSGSRPGLGVVAVKLERTDGGAPVYGEMEQFVPEVVPFEAVDELLAALGVGRVRAGSRSRAIRNGPVHVYVEFPSEDAVAALRPDIGAIERLGEYGINCFAGSGARWKTRMFGPALGVAEDPATGSAAGPLAVHLVRYGRIEFGTSMEIVQGVEIGRPSLLRARVEGSAAQIEARVRRRVGGGRGAGRVPIGLAGPCPCRAPVEYSDDRSISLEVTHVRTGQRPRRCASDRGDPRTARCGPRTGAAAVRPGSI